MTARRELLQNEMVIHREPEGAFAPVVFDSPHSGSFYPDDFRPAVPLQLLRSGEDRFVDELFADAPRHGAVLIAARFARTYLDPNRRLSEIDPALLDGPWPGRIEPSSRTERGVGLVFTKIGSGVPIYDRRLTTEEVQRRIDRCWRPYHDVLLRALDDAHSRYDNVWHINCHSMTAVGNELSPDPGEPRPDFVLGDRDGSSCSPAFTDFVASALEEMGYSVALNHPYKGAELVAFYSNPAEGRHSLQIEINRQLYMNADDLERHDGFHRLRADLSEFAKRVCHYAQRSTASPFSARC